jgi:uncharacterized protein GlcG (DUF336 family)
MISLSDASRVVDHALKSAREMNLPPMTVAVLDARGCLVSFKMEDGSSLLREQIARAKAWSALGMGMGTRTLMSRAAHILRSLSRYPRLPRDPWFRFRAAYSSARSTERWSERSG